MAILAVSFIHDEGVFGTPLKLACQYGQLPVVEYLMSTGRANILDRGHNNTASAPDVAAESGYLPCLRTILDYPEHGLRDAGLTPPGSDDGRRLLHHAIRSSAEEVINCVLEFLGLPTDTDERDSWKGQGFSDVQRDIAFQGLIAAIGTGRYAPIRLLADYFMLNNHMAISEVSKLDAQQLFGGRWYATSNNDLGAFKLLLELDNQRRLATGAVKDEFFHLTLHRCMQTAIKDGSLDVLRYLIEELGCDIYKVYSQDPNPTVGLFSQTALELAVEYGKLDIVRYLLEECSADVAVGDRVPLRTAISSRNTELLKLMLEYGGPVKAIQPSEELDFAGRERIAIETHGDRSAGDRDITLTWRVVEADFNPITWFRTSKAMSFFLITQDDQEWWRNVVQRSRRFRGVMA
ncbi:ankyrin repeat-containing domain protein [Stachybotrys elegans]|uniref:Ankyrin repeat-containing domain protein n=1 Tax=Stachybotrys elegans TaxID=80388 RepID=A0A8K0SFU3_9HYPO|nr:ankyrin repeat-containing domain protein [Stachybotrys elegans]